MVRDPAASAYRRVRFEHWDTIGRNPSAGAAASYYHRRLAEIYTHLVAPGQRVLEIGCGRGDLLAAVKPAFGVGIDWSGEMLRHARNKHPQLHLIQADAHQLGLEMAFDTIILSDVINDLWDVQRAFCEIRPLCHPRTRIVMNFFSRLWELPLRAVRRLGLARPVLEQNWLAVEDMHNLLHLSGFEPLRHLQEILLPIGIPVLDAICNRILVKFWPFRQLALTNIMVARPQLIGRAGQDPERTVSVIIPARNEAGNIEGIFDRVRPMGSGTELVFVEGGSTDDTFSAIQAAIARHPEIRAKLLKQPGSGKGDAVRAGFEAASGDVLMILDADLSLPPEDLPRFYAALRVSQAEFVNGVRLVYPMEKRSMRFLNLLANKLFGWAFSWLLGQPIRDTLCGTKALYRRDYKLIARNRDYFGDFDPFGDFDLLFGAAMLNLKIIEVPVRYRERTYGRTNISRFRHGWFLLRMMLRAARRLKFV